MINRAIYESDIQFIISIHWATDIRHLVRNFRYLYI